MALDGLRLYGQISGPDSFSIAARPGTTFDLELFMPDGMRVIAEIWPYKQGGKVSVANGTLQETTLRDEEQVVLVYDVVESDPRARANFFPVTDESDLQRLLPENLTNIVVYRFAGK